MTQIVSLRGCTRAEGGENVEKSIAYPVLEGKIAEKGIMKKRVAEALNITPHALRNKLSGKTEFTWNEVVNLQASFFPETTKEALMQRAGA